MSYVPSHQGNFPTAQPIALTVIEHTANTSQSITTTPQTILIGTIHNWYGSFTPTISSNQFTLASGYFYYIETSVQAYNINIDTNTMDFTFQHYDETNSAYIGTPATDFGGAGSSGDVQLFSRDATAKFVVDCTSAARNISIKMTLTDQYDHINYNSANYIYAGLGRTVIWQLDT
tara:strand:+ start:10230 stop:10754 length:525 start_codon:yes stop_codon:yes gene_type:complete